MSERANFDELSYEHGCALDYLQKFSKLNKKDAESMLAQLLNLGLTEKMAVKIIDILPENAEELKVVFYRSDLPENAEDVLDVICKFK
jgi:DNA-directed RNA polymerase subunit F